ncbi:unnamed protein product [Alopecurus aequalis]
MPPKKYKAPRTAADLVVVKVRKPRAPKPRPLGFTHAEWKADVDRRSVVSGERAKRGVAKRKRDAAAVEEESVVSPASFSPLVWAYSPSPDYADGDALGGFKPNTASQARGPPSFPVDPRAPPAFAIDPGGPPAFGPGPPRGPAFTANLNSPYSYSPAYSTSPSLCRGALPFGAGSSSTQQFSASDAEINDMITTGSAAAAAGAEGFYVDSQDTDAETEYTEQEDAEEEVEKVEASDPSVAGKRTNGAPMAQKPIEPRLKWTSKEDECLAESWKTVSIDPITGVNQNADNYWRRVKTAFEERKLVDPEFAGLFTDHGEKANYWAVIQQACNNRFAASFADDCISPLQMVRMFEMYRNDNEQAEFKFLNVFTMIESCEKWIECRIALAKNKEAVYNLDAPVAGADEGWPIGNKKAKAVRDMAAAAERLQSSINQCIADAKSHTVVRGEKSEARWTALMKKHDAKLDLLRTNVTAKKRNNGLAFLIGADTAAMDPLVHAWFMAERAIILNHMPAQEASNEDPPATEDPAATDEDPAATEDPTVDDTAPTTGSASLTGASPSPSTTADDLTV